MLDYTLEQQLAFQGFTSVCGIDEAGRGPLCGPVCAAAVILPAGLYIEGLDDSKKLSEKRRNALYEKITENALSYSVAYASPREIDELNILNATFLAMRRAVLGLDVTADFALVDGNSAKDLPIPFKCVVGGDGISPSIAAASILAKVSRDRLMLELDGLYPQYNLKKHKGYGTAEHYTLIARHGTADIYRKTFLKTLDKHLKRCEKASFAAKGR